MEVRYIGESAPLRCRKGKIYVVIAVEEKPDGGSYRVVDESGEDYPYLIKSFELVGGSVEDIDPNDPVFNLSPDGEEDNESEPQDVILFNKACDLIDTTGLGKFEDYQEGIKLLLQAAEIGNIDAMNNLGMLYYRGYGVKQDYTQALKWFRKGASYGNQVAYENLAMMYEKGCGVPRNRKLALDMYLAMAEEGSEHSMTSIGRLYYNGIEDKPDYQKALYWYSKAADEEDSGALDEIGWCYYEGHGVKQNYKIALEYFARAAWKGNDCAANDISLLYYHGYGVKQDYSQALCWAKWASAQGSGVATSNIAELYEEGKGVIKDLNIAAIWYKRAVALGYHEGQEALERLELHTSGFKCPLFDKEINDDLCRKITLTLLHDYEILKYSKKVVQEKIFSEYPSIADWDNAFKYCPDCPATFINKEPYKVLCPCCEEGYVELGHVLDICDVCGWMDDRVQYYHPHLTHGINKMSLYQARKAYKKGIKKYPYRQIRDKQVEKALKLLEKHGNED